MHSPSSGVSPKFLAGKTGLLVFGFFLGVLGVPGVDWLRENHFRVGDRTGVVGVVTGHGGLNCV